MKGIVGISGHLLQLGRDGHLLIAELVPRDRRRNRIRKLLQAEPVTVDGHPEVAQVDRLVGARQVVRLGRDCESGQRGRSAPGFR